jgi:Cu/Ag efflux pump CusA
MKIVIFLMLFIIMLLFYFNFWCMIEILIVMLLLFFVLSGGLWLMWWMGFNGDGLVNDPLTHVGIVETVEHDGTIVFISRVAGAIERYRMNVAQPHVHRTADGRLLNDYMRRKHWRDGEQTAYLTGELFAAFGTRVLESSSTTADRR